MAFTLKIILLLVLLELTFLDMTLRKTLDGILLHQQLYADDLLQEHAPHMSARIRTATGEPEPKRKLLDHQTPPIPEHQESIKKGLKDGFLVVSFGDQDMSRSCLLCVLYCSVWTHELELLKTKLRNLALPST